MTGKLELNLDDILGNNFLICDFIFEDLLKERLMNSDEETLKRFFDCIIDKNKVSEIVSLFTDGAYEAYYDKKYKAGKFDQLIEALKELTGTGGIIVLSRALANLAYGKREIRAELNEFIKQVGSAYLDMLNQERKNEEEKEMTRRYIKELIQKNIEPN